MDELDLPEIEPAFAEPDFFDAENGNLSLNLNYSNSINQCSTAGLQGSVLQESANHEDTDLGLSPPGNILENFGAAALKYDDEACEFDEFLVGVPKASSLTSTPACAKLTSGGEKEKETEQEGSLELENSQSEKAASECGSSANQSGSPKSVPELSQPNTPDSRASSSVIRLSMPMVKLSTENKKSKNKNIPKEEEPDYELSSSASSVSSIGSSSSRSPTRRSTRGMITGSRKRKKGDDGSSSDDEVDDETSVINKTRTLRSGRKTRKISRYGENEGTSDSSPVKNKDEVKSGKSRRLAGETVKATMSKKEVNSPIKNDSHMDIDNHSDASFRSGATSELFEPIGQNARKFPKPPTQIKQSRHWYADDGSVHFVDRNGTNKVFSSKYPYPKLIRLMESDIKRIKEQLEQEAVRKRIPLEVCIDNVESAKQAAAGGAYR